VFEIPKEANVWATYPITVTRDAREPETARAFVQWVLSKPGQEVLAAHGLIPVGSIAP
jgi:ABC-type Fe3+ transport system substrate-binding protein